MPGMAALNVRTAVTSGVGARLRFGAVLTIPTESGPDKELYGVFAWVIGYEGRYVRIGSALSGVSLLTAESQTNPNLGSRTFTPFEFHADFGRGKFRPGAELRVPLGQGYVTDFTSETVGLSFSYSP